MYMNNLIYALLVIPIVLIVSIAVFGGFSSNIDRGTWDANANASFTKVTSGTWAGFSLGSQLPFIYIAIAVVSAILAGFGLKVF